MKRSICVKATVFILCVLSLMVTVFSVIGTVLMVNGRFYTRSYESIRREALSGVMLGYAEEAYNQVEYGYDTESYFASINLYFKITHLPDGELVYSNYKGESYDFVKDFIITEYHSAEVPSYYGYTSDRINTEKQVDYNVSVYLPKEYKTTDRISFTDSVVKSLYSMRNVILIIGASSLLAFAVFLVILCSIAGWKKGEEKPRTSFFDRIPYDIFVLVYTVLAICSMIPFLEIYLEDFEIALAVFFVTLADSVLLVSFIYSTAARAKTGEIFKDTLIGIVLRYIIRGIRFVLRAIGNIIGNLPLYGKTILIAAAIFLWIVLAFLFAGGGDSFGIFLIMVLGTILSALAFYLTYTLDKIFKGGEKIAGGDIDHKIDIKYMLPTLKKHAESLNNIGGGMSLALGAKLKSERFKTELITNVSHDLKTPLTSIVNYVDLIKTEREQPEPDEDKLSEYIDVLDRQSERLRKLTEDLVEASKAQTGNLEVNPEALELCEMISQTEGEYGDRLASLGLSLIVNTPETPVFVRADGKHIWRIFDNLMNNITKYAMCGTRVYINITVLEGKAYVIFRNTSKYELKVSADELTERFVRGDLSRHTEGSGLGLSIAKSLAELNGAKLDIYTDGDLFKVVIEFDVSENECEF